MNKQLMIKPEKCLGCRTCEIICSWNRGKNFNPRNAAVSVVMFEEAAVSVPVMCLQCEDACCIKVCPVGAMHREPDGTVATDSQKCIVCKMCVNACPLGNVSFSSTARKIVKCELCGGDPACAKYCPSGSLLWTDEGDGLGRRKAVAMALKTVFGEEESK
ncbi:MAG: 4Fe-4S dicluster domain-containing protein [Spirochaetales bacterium]|jgi:Fe-S-cluster-containing hydrogenase component 2|nr:4Fe-4S dicluster domain-containing protein [Spirochaetales bacterium]